MFCISKPYPFWTVQNFERDRKPVTGGESPHRVTSANIQVWTVAMYVLDEQ